MRSLNVRALLFGTCAIVFSVSAPLQAAPEKMIRMDSPLLSPPYSPPGPNSPTAQEQAEMRAEMSRMSIDRKEYLDRMIQSFDAMDRNHDGKLSADELSAPGYGSDNDLMRRNGSMEADIVPQSPAANTRTPVSNTANTHLTVKSPAGINSGNEPNFQVGIPPINANELK